MFDRHGFYQPPQIKDFKNGPANEHYDKWMRLVIFRHSIERVPRTTPSVSFLWISSVWCNKANSYQTVVFLALSDILGRTISFFFFKWININFITSFCYPSLFLGEGVNFLLRGANRLNNSKNNIRKVHCFDAHLLKVNERGHIPYGKKRAFISTNETGLLAFI